MYTIGQVSEMFDLPISTLRYYDKQGLFPEMTRVSGIRKFDDTEIDALSVIECLKRSGLEIKDIKQFMDWCMEGASTYPQRKELFERQRRQVEAEMERMNQVLDMLKFKWSGLREYSRDIQGADPPDQPGTDPAAGLVHCEHPLGGSGLRCIGGLHLQLLRLQGGAGGRHSGKRLV